MSKEYVNASYIQSLTVGELKIIFLNGFSTGLFKGFDLDSEGDKVREISEAFGEMEEKGKEMFRQALYQATMESVASSFEQKVITGLIYLSRLIGANNTMDYLSTVPNIVEYELAY